MLIHVICVSTLTFKNKDVFEEKNDQYNVSVSVAMSSDNLPDLMLVGSIEDLRQLVALDLIEDLTKSYENCLTDRIKDIYASYGEGIIDGVTFDGKINGNSRDKY